MGCFSSYQYFFFLSDELCHVKPLGVDKKALKTSLPPSCQCPAHLNTFVFRVIVQQAARVTEMVNALKNSIPNNNALQNKTSLFGGNT